MELVWECFLCEERRRGVHDRQAHAQAVESEGNCAALAAVLITVHRQDWSGLLDDHYCC